MTVKNLPTILLLLATILSSVAIALPLWSKTKKELGGSVFSGLWSACELTTATNNTEQVCCVNFEKKMDPPPKAILVSQIVSIVGAVFAAIAALLFVRGNKNYSALFAFISLLCMITTLVVYPVVSLKDLNKSCDQDGCFSLDASYGLQAGATALTLLGFVLIKRK
jgi:hypothetical protein